MIPSSYIFNPTLCYAQDKRICALANSINEIIPFNLPTEVVTIVNVGMTVAGQIIAAPGDFTSKTKIKHQTIFHIKIIIKTRFLNIVTYRLNVLFPRLMLAV